MEHSDFTIGMTFFTATGPWRCTDIGTRVIVAIVLKPRNMVRCTLGVAGTLLKESFISDDPRDLEGPPYGVVEIVFDEADLDGCYTNQAEMSEEDESRATADGAQESGSINA